MAASKYSDEIRAAAMGALLAGQSVSQVARDYKLPKGTVSDWKTQAHEVRAGSAGDRPKNNVGVLLLEYLEANLRALKSQVEVFADQSWLRGQEASQLAVLHGVQADKAVRMLEAMNPPEPEGT